MSIQKLPEYLINRLKAGEIVERPSSVVKELMENSLDAGAKKISVDIHDGGKKLIQVEDNGTGIELSDMDLLLERYATSKIQSEEDLFNIHSYGFRGEALASISEVSKISILSKTKYAEIATKISKRGTELVVKHQPCGFYHGTIINIEDLFYNVPARLKFLKGSQTEYYYCYQHFVDNALFHPQKHFILKKNEKIIFDLESTDNIQKRIDKLFKKNISENLIPIPYKNEWLTLTGFVSDAYLRFGSREHIKIYVNQRPIHDKIISRALMDAYKRQIAPGEYPFALLFLQCDPKQVDVNVHPKKSEVKFIAPRDIYQIIYDTISNKLGDNKIARFSGTTIGNSHSFDYKKTFNQQNKNTQSNFHKPQSTPFFTNRDTNIGQQKFNLSSNATLDAAIQNMPQHNNSLGEYQITGQLRNSYIIIQANDALFYVDQHALAERIAFEAMKKEVQPNAEKDISKLETKSLLQPISISLISTELLDDKIEQLQKLGFDCELIGENKVAVYGVPDIFVQYKVDLETLFQHCLELETINYDHILNGIFATKACKGSIKAGQKLSYEQMKNLINQGFEKIPGMFVCQHGRPFFIQIDKDRIDKMFDR